QVDIYFNQFTAGLNGGGWHVLATNVHFTGPNPRLRLANDSNNNGDINAGRRSVADAVQFVADDRSKKGVIGAPLISNVTWPSGTQRRVVYFATTGGEVFALDALGVGGASLNTTVYWSYPSISNPDATSYKPGTNAYSIPENDPNVNPDI